MVLVTFSIGKSVDSITVDYALYINKIKPYVKKASRQAKGEKEMRREIMRMKNEEVRI